MAKDTTSLRLLVDKLNTKSQVCRQFGLVPGTDGKPKKWISQSACCVLKKLLQDSETPVIYLLVLITSTR